MTIHSLTEKCDAYSTMLCKVCSSSRQWAKTVDAAADMQGQHILESHKAVLSSKRTEESYDSW